MMLSACDPSTKVDGSLVTALQPRAALANVAAGARRCWFAGNPRFSRYALLDERDSRNARLLVVLRTNPQGRPEMVIERGADGIDVYGPLADAHLRGQVRIFARSKGARCP